MLGAYKTSRDQYVTKGTPDRALHPVIAAGKRPGRKNITEGTAGGRVRSDVLDGAISAVVRDYAYLR